MKPIKELQLLSEAELLKLVTEKQDSRALGILMSRFRGFLKTIVHGFLLNTMFEDDAIQEIWIKVCNALQQHGYKEESHFPSWLGRIAEHHCLDELKKKKDKIFTDVYNEEGEEILYDDSKNPEELLMITDEVQSLLSSLSPYLRKVVQKRFLEDKNVEDTAAELHMTKNSVRVALSEALDILRRKAGKR